MRPPIAPRDTLASRLLVPIAACGVAITLLGAAYLVVESRRAIVNQAGQSARSIAYQVGQDRQKYIRRMDAEGADPTFLHEIGMSEGDQSLYQVNLLGLWPVNPAHAPRDSFEARALRALLADPRHEASRVHTVKGEPRYTYLRAEIAASGLCVDCHGAQLAGTDHRVSKGAPIGALVVEVPLGRAMAAARASTVRAIGVLALIMSAAVAALLLVLRRLVERPVAALLPAVEPLAAGDFSRPVRVQAVAEIARIARAVEDTRAQVAGVIGELSRTVGAVQEASDEVADRATAISTGSHEQAQALDATSGSLRAMTDTVRANADHAQQAHRLAAHTSDQAEQGGAALREAVDAMTGLSAASARIADISATIDEIAFQTNLLALNASIEAARAGAQGRSFAVVASEVRALAQRSGVASREIRHVVTDAVQRADESTRRVTHAGRTLGGIVDEVKQVASLVAVIAEASAAQAREVEQVARAATQMDGATQQAAHASGELDRTARALADQAAELRRQVGRFTLEPGGTGASDEPLSRAA